jgi:hypothetical protein
MRSEQEIREELERIEREFQMNIDGEDVSYVHYLHDMLNSRKWTLKWVLGEEE